MHAPRPTAWIAIVLGAALLAGCLGPQGSPDADDEETPRVGGGAPGSGEDGGVPALPEPKVFQAQVSLKCEQCYDLGKAGSVSYLTGQDGIDSVWIDFGAGLDELPFRLTGGVDPDIWFHTACDGNELAWFAEYGPEEGVVPKGATCGWLYEWESLDGAQVRLTIG